MEIKRFEQFPPKVKAIIEKEGADIVVGAMYIAAGQYRRNDTVIRISKIVFVKKTKWREEHVMVHFDHATNWECTKWSQYGSSEVSQFNENYIRLTKPIAEYLKEVQEIIDGKLSIDHFRDKESDTLSSGTALISKNSKQGLMAIQGHLEEKKKGVEVLAAVMGFEMERRKQELDKIKEKLYGVVAEFKKKITKIMRVITTIELYLGIDEEIFQVQDGPRASADTPISFRQQVLYMDEEIGHWKDGGLDFTDIKWFDEWLIKKENFKRLCPEEKCVLVFRPRRNRKDYGGDPWEDAMKNAANLGSTYLMIRNGECLYRIYTEKIVILPRLFPKRKEFLDLLKEVEDEKWDRYKEEKKEMIEDKHYQYRKRAFILQGLIDRADVFHPLSQKISIFNMDATPGMINFIYDDEDALPSGRLSFDQWRKSINDRITEGSRILVTGHYSNRGYINNKDFKDRLYYYCNDYNAPSPPSQGVYEVVGHDKVESEWMNESEYQDVLNSGVEFKLMDTHKKKYHLNWKSENQNEEPVYSDGHLIRKTFRHLTIMHNPGGETSHGWGDWGHERKNRIRFRILHDDPFILNYDQIDIADIDFYITSRVDRPNYLDMMPVLKKIKDERLKELANEKEFMKFVVSRNIKIINKPESEIKKMVVDSVIWWKYKNKWKRPIAKDDTLALRMIEKRIQSKNYKPHT